MYIAQKLEHGALVKWDFLVRATIKFAGHASLESKQHLNHYRKNPYCDQRLFGEKLDDHIMICQNAFLVVDLVVADFVEGNFGGAGVRQSIGSWSRGSERGDILAHWGAHGGGVETLVGGFSRLKILPGMVILTFDIFRFQHVETTSRKQLYHLHPWSTVRTLKFWRLNTVHQHLQLLRAARQVCKIQGCEPCVYSVNQGGCQATSALCHVHHALKKGRPRKFLRNSYKDMIERALELEVRQQQLGICGHWKCFRMFSHVFACPKVKFVICHILLLLLVA